jgi:hypothetical protein
VLGADLTRLGAALFLRRGNKPCIKDSKRFWGDQSSIRTSKAHMIGMHWWFSQVSLTGAM